MDDGTFEQELASARMTVEDLAEVVNRSEAICFKKLVR
jgi:hypothetical protein